jgi:hypothetical protein
MLYEVRRFRLLAALKVGILGGLSLGALGGFLFPALLVFMELLFRFNTLGSFFNSGGVMVVFVMLTLSMTAVGAIGGAIAGGVIMTVLGLFYNMTSRYTGGLLVELEPRGKLKEKSSVRRANEYDREETSSYSPRSLEDLLEDEVMPSESEVHADSSSAIRRRAR